MARTERELSDAQWARLALLLPPQRPRMGRLPKDHRLIVEAIVWLCRTGTPWRDLSGEFGPWATVASRFYRWRRQGAWDRVLAWSQADADARGQLEWLVHFVDASVVRAHQHAAGTRRRPAKADLAASTRGARADPDQSGEREALGRSRGGYSTKVHLRVEGGGKPMVILASAGQRHEAPMLRRLLETGAVKRPGRGRPRLRPGAASRFSPRGVETGIHGFDIRVRDRCPQGPSTRRAPMNVESPLHVLKTDLAFPESPRWHDGRLWVSDWGAQEVLAVDLEGRSEVVARVESLMCIHHLPDGRLLVVSSTERRLLRRQADGSLVTHGDLGALGEHPWNDIVVDGRGNAYVNNIGFDFPAGEFAPGFVVLVSPDGTARQVADGLAFPNGMAVTPDNATLIVAESYGQKLTAFDIAADGSLSNRRTWAEVDDHPDGICLDADGAIWYGDVGNKRCVRVREGGEVLQVIDLDRGCFACVLGGPDRRTLFMTVNEWSGAENRGGGRRMGQVITAEAPARGVGWP